MKQKILLKIAKSGDPTTGVVEEKAALTANKDKITQDLDLRDRLAELVGLGNTITSENKAAIYGNLKRLLGEQRAQKVMNHAFIFNSRPDVQKLPVEERLKSFYTIGANDPEVMEVIGRTKNLGQGVVPGFRGSASAINQDLAGVNPAVVSVNPNDELKKKVLLRIGK